MQFRLRTLMLLFVILWSALAACGAEGIIAAFAIVVLAACIYALDEVTLKEWLVVHAILLVLIGLLLPAFKKSHDSPEGRCRFQLRQLAQALLAYHDQYGSLPPACVLDQTGKPMHSWRVQMLPFLEQRDMYEAYDFSQPWNSATNAAVSGVVRCLACPSDPSCDRPNASDDFTTYFAVVGPQTAWRRSSPVRLSALPDRGRHMILLVESADRTVNWKEPKDLSYEEASTGINRQRKPCISSTHVEGGDYFHYSQRGAYAAFADGRVHFLPEDISPEDLQALLTGDTTRDIDLDSLDRPRLNWSHIVALAILIASSALLLVGTLVQRFFRPARSDAAEEAINSQQPPTAEDQ
jgi:hypothetical protein